MQAAFSMQDDDLGIRDNSCPEHCHEATSVQQKEVVFLALTLMFLEIQRQANGETKLKSRGEILQLTAVSCLFFAHFSLQILTRKVCISIPLLF
ncbi:Hypothetical predicted protein [Podarcis lilfordi]|uniref:Uncharacterized protein n=1 Tax=Podarcis lilfordi TaxID=74358 RepID=A0AA35NX03_9SAUR|nr:Hypothetical predicted protein [Podarcis lilfordi]